MADFSGPCKQAREALQKAHDQLRSGQKSKESAQEALNKARREVSNAGAELKKAEQARDRANQLWDELISEFRKDPTFSLPGIEAEFKPADPQNPMPDLTVGPVPVRGDVTHAFYRYAGSREWDTEAFKATQGAQGLKTQAELAKKRHTEKEKLLEDAKRTESDADGVLKQAVRKILQSQQDLKDSRAIVQRICSGKSAEIMLPGGTILKVDPTYLPLREKRVKDIIKKLPQKELKGLVRIELRDKLGPETTKVDPKTGKNITTRPLGLYSHPAAYIFIYKPSEEPEVVFKHEVGHHVYYGQLSEKLQKRWTEFWSREQNSQQTPKGKMPTGYATTKDIEGFAEVYEYYRDNKPLHPDAKKIMEEILKSI